MTRKLLAIEGGQPTIDYVFEKFNTIGIEEEKSVREVIKTGNLSNFLGRWDNNFFGGPKVLEFENQLKKYFKVQNAVVVNSWTSGLVTALGSVGIQPGDEVIVSTWTMSATATAILQWNAIPVFADIEDDTFCIDPVSIENNISPYTKAIIAVDIFGQSSNMDKILAIAKKYNLVVVSDAAQAPGSFYKGNPTGTLAHVGGFSLNYHKHIHTGEGGIIVTNDDFISEKLQLIRNHAESVIGSKSTTNLPNMIGNNFRLGEIECAIGIEQLKKLDSIVSRKQEIAQALTERLNELDGLITPVVRENCTHSYYVYPLKINLEKIAASRERIVDALRAEGIPGLSKGYANIHMLPMYQSKIAYGNSGFPWTSDICRREISYQRGICPTAENLHESTFFSFALCAYELYDNDIDLIYDAFKKVWGQLKFK